MSFSIASYHIVLLYPSTVFLLYPSIEALFFEETHTFQFKKLGFQLFFFIKATVILHGAPVTTNLGSNADDCGCYS